MRSAKTSDGRVLAYEVGGDPSGYPVIGLHGTPGCRFNRSIDDQVYADAGVWFITPDRSGYGQSERHRGRKVADAAVDVAAIADTLGLDKFAVVGGSGGGPHALACAALLAHRVERAASLSGPAPYGDAGLDRAAWTAGMSPPALHNIELSEAGEAALEDAYRQQQAEMVRQLEADPSQIFAERLGEADLEFLRRPDTALALARVIPEQAAHGVSGWVDDSLAFISAWGFDPASIAIPILIRYGSLDQSVPPAHGDWLTSHLPTAVAVVDPTGGHMPKNPTQEIQQNMAWLARGVIPQP